MHYVNQAVGAMSMGAMSVGTISVGAMSVGAMLLKQMAPQKELESADSKLKKK